MATTLKLTGVKRVIPIQKEEQPVELQTVELMSEIHRRALDFCCDNPGLANNVELVKTIMMIGASIAMEQTAG